VSPNKDQVRGRVEEAKGKIKDVAGKPLGDKTMHAKANRRVPSARQRSSQVRVMPSNTWKNQLRNGGNFQESI